MGGTSDDTRDVGDDAGSVPPSVIRPYAANELNVEDFVADVGGDEFHWSVTDEPEELAARLIDADTPTPTIIARLPGRYELAVEITDGAETDTQLIALRAKAHGCPEPTIVDGHLDEGTSTWTDSVDVPGCTDYLVTRDLRFSTNGLTIESGVVVTFDDSSLAFTGGATLEAVGTLTEPVALTGLADSSWPGLSFQDTITAHLEHVIIEAGGEGRPLDSAGLELVDSEGVEMSELYVTRSPNYGLHVRGPDTNIGSFTDSIVTGNAAAPVWIEADEAHSLEASNRFGGNGEDWIAVGTDSVEETVTWQKFDVPYRVLNPVEEQHALLVNGDLTIAAGTTLTFETQMGLAIRGNLSAVGTEDATVVFTGTEPRPGHWRGIAVEEGTATFEHVVIEYGGSDRYSVVSERANLLIIQNGPAADVTIRDSTIRESGAHGFYQRMGTTLTFENNVVTGNTLSAGIVPIDSVRALGADSTYTGNGRDAVMIDPAEFSGGTWEDLGVEYVVRQTTNPVAFCVTGGLQLEPGVTLRFENDVGMRICPDGALEAIGTQMNPIEFLPSQSGESWRGILIQHGHAEFDHIVVEDAGSTPYVSDRPGCVTLVENSADPGVTASADFGDETQGSGCQYGIVFGGVNTYAPNTPGCFGMGPIYRADPERSPQCN